MVKCSGVMIVKLEVTATVKDAEEIVDTTMIMKLIKLLSLKNENHKYNFHLVHIEMRRFYILHQKEGMTSQQYLDQFMNQTNVIDHCGGTIRDQVSTQNIIIHICVSTTTDDEMEVTMENDE